MNRRIAIVILLSLGFLLAGCQQAEPISDETIAEILGDVPTPDADRLFFDIGLTMQWVSPNPNDNWTPGGRELQRFDRLSTRIVFRPEAKITPDESFEDAVARLTEADVIFDETDSGDRYARASTPVSDYVIYRDFPTHVVVIILTDLASDTIDPAYVAEWQTIALEGGLNILE